MSYNIKLNGRAHSVDLGGKAMRSRRVTPDGSGPGVSTIKGMGAVGVGKQAQYAWLEAHLVQVCLHATEHPPRRTGLAAGRPGVERYLRGIR